MDAKPNNRGSVLVAVLWCMVLLSVVVIGLLHTTRLDLRLAKNYGDRIQAHYLALAGAERAKAILFRDCTTRRQTSTSHTGAVYDDQREFGNIQFGRGRYSVLRPGREDESGGAVIYGVSDEESRLNVNTISSNEFSHVPRMTTDVAAAIIDWRDADDETTPGGAERDYYASAQPSSEPRNSSLETIRELLMVRGISQELLLGEPAENESEELSSELGGFLESGWASVFTVQSTDKNISADGSDRVNLQNADESTLSGIQGVTTTIARAIVAQRGRQQLQSIVDLLDVRAQQQNTRGGNNAGTNGPTLIDQKLFEDIADRVTVDSNPDQAGLVNVNTAGLIVLQCLPGIDENLARAIMSHRKSNGFFTSIAGLLNVPGMTRDKLKQVAPLITTRSETFRIVSEGRIASSGARQRIETIVHVSPREARTLSYREDL